MPKKIKCLSSGKDKPTEKEKVKVIEELRHKYKNLKNVILEIFNNHKGNYGYQRITLELHNQGLQINHKLILKLMCELGLKCKKKRAKYRSYKGTVGLIAPNALDRCFHAKNPNQKWVTDVTEFNIPAGKLYLSPHFRFV